MDGGSWHSIGDRDQDHPQEKEMQKGKMVVWEGFTNSYEKKGSKKQRRKGEIYPSECRVPKIARRDKKAFLSDQCKEIEENNRMGKSRDLFKKIRATKGTFHAKMATIKDRNGMDLIEEDVKKRCVHVRPKLPNYHFSASFTRATHKYTIFMWNIY